MKENTVVYADSSKILKRLFVAFDAIDYAVLRNGDDIFSSLRGDIDLSVSKTDVNKLLQCLHHICKREALGSFILEEHYHGIRLVVASKEKLFFLKLDIHFFESWRGIKLLSAEEIIKDAKVNEVGIKIASKEHQALIIWLTSVLQGADLREKYRPLVTEYLETISEKNPHWLSRKMCGNILLRPDFASKRSYYFRIKCRVILRALQSIDIARCIIFFQYIRTTLVNLLFPRGFYKQFHAYCSKSLDSELVRKGMLLAAPGFPILLLDRKPKISRPRFTSVFRSYEAIIYMTPELDDNDRRILVHKPSSYEISLDGLSSKSLISIGLIQFIHSYLLDLEPLDNYLQL